MFKARSRKGFDNSLRSEQRLLMLEKRIEAKETRNKVRQIRRVHSKAHAIKVPYECQLYLGEKPFPRFKMMTIFERKIANNDFEDKFTKTFNRQGETTKKLTSWRWVDWRKVKQGGIDYMHTHSKAT